MSSRTFFACCATLTLAMACGGGEPPAPAEPACGLNNDTIDGRTFVMLEAMPDGDVENAQARVKFEKRDGVMHALYTVKSFANVYDYTCDLKGEEYVCHTDLKLEYVCKALEVTGVDSCTADKLKEFGATQSDADIAKAIETAKAQVVAARKAGGDTFKRFKLTHNNVGTPAQGMLYVKVDTKNCRIKVDDMSAIIYNGKRKEDFNPVGTNPFVETKEEYIFEDCVQQRLLADMETAEAPASAAAVPATRNHTVGKPVHYFYVGNEGIKATEGCTYTADTYANWKPVGKDLAITPAEDGSLIWTGSHTWAAEDLMPVGGGAKGTVFHLVRETKCEGKEPVRDVTCAVAAVN